MKETVSAELVETLEKPSCKVKCCAFCKHYVPGQDGIIYSGFLGIARKEPKPPTCNKCRNWVDYSRIPCQAAREDEGFCGRDAKQFEPAEHPEDVIPKELW